MGAGTLGQERVRGDRAVRRKEKQGLPTRPARAAQHLGEVPSLPLSSHAHPFIAPWTLKLRTRDSLGPGADGSLQAWTLASSQSCLAPNPCSSTPGFAPGSAEPGLALLFVAQLAGPLWHELYPAQMQVLAEPTPA